MQNLGYYQLQANPGLWVLNLAPGKATQLFTIDGAVASSASTLAWGALDGIRVAGGKVIAVRSHADIVNRITVTKKPGMERVSLLEDDGDDSDEDDADGNYHT
jgi:UDP-glucose:glycoprotein glucosyltransferase